MKDGSYSVVTAGGKRHIARWFMEDCRCRNHEGRWMPLCYQRAQEWIVVEDGLSDCSRCIREVHAGHHHYEVGRLRAQLERAERFVTFLDSLVDPTIDVALDERAAP